MQAIVTMTCHETMLLSWQAFLVQWRHPDTTQAPASADGPDSSPTMTSSASGELSEEFWASAEYCGYLRSTFEPGTAGQTGHFLNRAYARLAGLDEGEMLSR